MKRGDVIGDYNVWIKTADVGWWKMVSYDTWSLWNLWLRHPQGEKEYWRVRGCLSFFILHWIDLKVKLNSIKNRVFGWQWRGLDSGGCFKKKWHRGKKKVSSEDCLCWDPDGVHMRKSWLGHTSGRYCTLKTFLTGLFSFLDKSDVCLGNGSSIYTRSKGHLRFPRIYFSVVYVSTTQVIDVI
jgi:hypothetical protein